MKNDIKCRICNFIIYFILYAFIGWIYEVVLEFADGNGFVNRGILFGPYLPVYGFGALAFIFSIYPMMKDKEISKKILLIPVIFLGCMMIATIIELLTSYICEFFMGSWPWQTYAEYKYNFEARIALDTSLRFGLGGVFFLYVLQPLFEKITSKMEYKKLNIVSICIIVILCIDMIYSFAIK